MSIMETTQESLQKTVEGVKDSQTLEKAIQTGVGLTGYNLSAPAKQLVPSLLRCVTSLRVRFLKRVRVLIGKPSLR